MAADRQHTHAPEDSPTERKALQSYASSAPGDDRGRDDERHQQKVEDLPEHERGGSTHRGASRCQERRKKRIIMARMNPRKAPTSAQRMTMGEERVSGAK